MLQSYFQKDVLEAGCDEAGRGCLAGPVFAAAVILPQDFFHPLLNDSKQVTEKDRLELRAVIEKEAIAYSVTSLCNKKVDKYNILQASVKGMQQAVKSLAVQPGLLLIDGHYFKRYKRVPHKCIVQGDALFASIAAASILAKTYRDEHMIDLHKKFPQYNWIRNKGYGTKEHQQALVKWGPCRFHRTSFRLDYTTASADFEVAE